MEKEILFCIEIINLFGNESLSNVEVFSAVFKNDFRTQAHTLNAISQERDIPDGCYYIPSHTIMDYAEQLEKSIQVLEENEGSYRYGYSFLTYLSRIQKLFWNYDLDAPQMWEYTQLLKNDIGQMHLLKYIVQDLIRKEGIESTYFYIEQMPELEYSGEETKSEGYIFLLEYFAEKGDLTRFTETLKNSNARKNRGAVQGCKSTFVYHFAKQNSIESVLILIGNKIFGTKYLPVAISSYAEIRPYKEICKLLNTTQQFQDLKYEDKVSILHSSYINDRTADNDEVVFEEIFNLIAPIDRKIRNGDAKLVDSLLFDLGLCVNYNKDWFVRCRKAIKNNSMKRELNDIYSRK